MGPGSWRTHDDLDVQILRDDEARLAELLAGWELFAARRGELTPGARRRREARRGGRIAYAYAYAYAYEITDHSPAGESVFGVWAVDS